MVEPEASPFCSPMSIWLDKAGLVERAEPTERMNAGKYLEEAILKEWNRRNERWFVFNESPYIPFAGIGATPDGLDVGQDAREGAEVKTVTNEVRHLWDNGTPRYVWWQAQHEMLCANLSRVVVIAQFGFSRLAHEWIEADKEAHERIVKACAEMWKRIHGELPPPEADGSDATTNALKRRKTEARSIALPIEAQVWSEELSLLYAAEKKIADSAQKVKNKIRAAMGDASTGLFPDGSGWCIQTINRKESVVKASTYTSMKRIKSKDAEEGDE